MNEAAGHIVARLGLEPHPEGGYYRQTWSAPADPGERASGTAIYYLLGPGDVSAWHRVDAAEIWHHYDGGPLEMQLSLSDDGPVTTHVLGTDLASEQHPQIIVPAGAWQTARPLAGPVLVGCTVSPGFVFSGWELAPEGWEPGTTLPQRPDASR